MVTPGTPKFGRFSALKNSARNCAETLSAIVNSFERLKSKFVYPGPLKMPTPEFPKFVLCAVLHLLLTRTAVGRDIYAVGGNKQAAMLCGIPVNSRLTLAYAISGAMAGLGAIVLAGRMNSGFPLAGMGAEIDAIAAVIIGGASFFGGVGTVSGTLIGALMIGVVIVMAVWIDVERQRAR